MDVQTFHFVEPTTSDAYDMHMIYIDTQYCTF